LKQWVDTHMGCIHVRTVMLDSGANTYLNRLLTITTIHQWSLIMNTIGAIGQAK
jgi:hypothetical protein